MTYTLANISLGQVQEENHSVSSNLDTETYPMSGSKDIEALDNGNVVRKITIRGRYTDTSTNVMNNFIQPIDALQNGDQNVITFHSDMWDLTTVGNYTSGNFLVKVEHFRPSIKVGEETSVEYTLELVESI